MARRNAFRLNSESGIGLPASLGENVIEQHAIHTSDEEIRIGMHIVIIGNGFDIEIAFGAEKNLVGDRPSKRAHASSAQIGQGLKA